MSSTASIVPTHPSLLDDEIAAWCLCLEDIHGYNFEGISTISDSDVESVLDFYLEEVESHLTFLNDMKIAHSIARAVSTDSAAIAEAAHEEIQCQEDRGYALRVSSDDPMLEAPPPSIISNQPGVIDEETVRCFEEMVVQDDYDLEEQPESGPSVPYIQRQVQALDKRFECIACGCMFPEASTSILECKHQYCNNCLKRVIMGAVKSKNLSLLPPKCCKIPIAQHIITRILDEDELGQFQLAEVEKAATVKVYCTALNCGEFIQPELIEEMTATCPKCSAKTCVRCKSPLHDGDCNTDEDTQKTLQLGGNKNWQQCYSCHRLVEKNGFGCNHMTCVCGVEFCYVCGAAWKPHRQCVCALMNEADIEERAVEVVNRDAPLNLELIERHRRIQNVREDLWNVSQEECGHPGRFRRITEFRPRRGFLCELCDERKWKYILQCRRCHLNVCEDCRRNRI